LAKIPNFDSFGAVFSHFFLTFWPSYLDLAIFCKKSNGTIPLLFLIYSGSTTVRAATVSCNLANVHVQPKKMQTVKKIKHLNLLETEKPNKTTKDSVTTQHLINIFIFLQMQNQKPQSS